MIPISDFSGAELAVYGLGETGLSAARALRAGGAVPYVWDDRPERCEIARKEGFVTVNLMEVDWTRFLALVLAPGLPLTHHAAQKAKALNIPVISDIELFARAMGEKGNRKARIIAVTGTNGKSITTALIGHILSRNGFDARVGGNIVSPALALEPPGADTIYVLELSSFQLESTYTLAPDVAVLLNLLPDHLDRHGSMEVYSAVKAQIFQGQGERDLAVVGIDDDHSLAIFKHLCEVSRESGTSVVPISTGAKIETGLYVESGYLYDTDLDTEKPIADLMDMTTLPGRHNWQNAAAAFAAVRRVLPDTNRILAGMKTFPGVAHRMEIVATVDHVWFINDSKATNAEAAARALDCYEEVYWIAGGRAKDGDWDPVHPFMSRVRQAFFIGEAGPAMAQAFEGEIQAHVCSTLDQAVAAAYAAAARDGAESSVVLFSPACTSFDQYPNFEVRGDAFRTIVRAVETARLRGQAGGPAGEAP